MSHANLISRMCAGFTLVELLVVIGIIGALVGIMLPAIELAQEAAWTSACKNNLRQIGTALECYEDVYSCFPTAYANVNTGEKRVFYRWLGPFVEQGPADPSADSSTLDPIVTYLCPSRRGSEAGVKDDYGSAALPTWFSPGTGSPVGTPEGSTIINHGPYASPNVRRGMIVDGTGCTLMLAHKGLEPRDYLGMQPVPFPDSSTYYPIDYGPDPTHPEKGYWQKYMQFFDAGWGWTDSRVWWEVHRFPMAILPDRDGGHHFADLAYYDGWFPVRFIPCQFYFTSPHRAGMPSLFGDGSVRTLGYTSANLNPQAPWTDEYLLLCHLWTIEDGNTLPDSALGN